MIFIRLFIALSMLFAAGCSTGNLGASCNPDGTCNGAHLHCVEMMNGFGGPIWKCVPRQEGQGR